MAVDIFDIVFVSWVGLICLFDSNFLFVGFVVFVCLFACLVVLFVCWFVGFACLFVLIVRLGIVLLLFSLFSFGKEMPFDSFDHQVSQSVLLFFAPILSVKHVAFGFPGSSDLFGFVYFQKTTNNKQNLNHPQLGERL